MPETNLFWIDDSVGGMVRIAEHVFPLLWDRDYSCATFFFGNAYCAKQDELGPQDEDRKMFLEEIKNCFISYCQDIDERDWEKTGTTYNKKKGLLDCSPVTVIDLQDSKNEHQIHTLAKAWMDKEKIDNLKATTKSTSSGIESFLESSKMSAKPLVDMMNIPTNAVVALDILLLYGDDARIREKLPIISMAIYYYLTGTSHKCYLYSSLALPQSALESWGEIYNSCFDASIAPPTVYPRGGLDNKRTDTLSKTKLIQSIAECGRNGG